MADEKDRSADLLIREVDEELQRERFEKLWKRYGGWVIGAAVAVVLVVAGNQGWQYWQAQVRADEALRYGQALQALDAGDEDGALAIFAALGGEGRTGYALLSQLRRAEILAAGGEVEQARAVYDSIAGDASKPQRYRELALLRGVLLRMEDGDTVGLSARLDPLMDEGSPWRHVARELAAVLAQQNGETDDAAALLRQVMEDDTAPQGARRRAADMLAALGRLNEVSEG